MVRTRAGASSFQPPQLDRAAFQHSIDQTVLTPAGRQITGLGGDQHFASSLHLLSSGGLRIHYGMVVSVQPYINSYKVQVDDLRGTINCCALGHGSSFSPIGVRDTSPILPGSFVILAIASTDVSGIILGIVPWEIDDRGMVSPDWIVQGSNAGFHRERLHFELPKIVENAGGLRDFSCSRPLDSTAAGEYGYLSDTGIGVFIDSFMAYLRVNEVCGIFFNYFDNHARLAGWNFDEQTSGSERSVRCDEGEIQISYGDTPYPHEALGAFEAGTKIAEEHDDVEVQYRNPVAKWEPVDRDQRPFYRYREYGGYLGQGRSRFLVLPPQGQTKYRYQDAEQVSQAPVNVFSEQLGLDGHYFLRSAKGLIIAKRPGGATPEQRRVPEDRNGDDREKGNYKFAGLSGGGPDHKIQDPKNPEDAETAHLLSAATVMDLHAFVFNWKGLHPFHYHTKDYKVPQEEDGKLKTFKERLSFSSLRSKPFMDRPEPVKLKVDERYKEVEYFENESYFALLDDGGLVFGDGYGAELRLTGGNAYITAPGDVFLLPGRTLHAWGGDDVVIRAKNSIDLSATAHDIRFKAKRNMELLAGNPDEGQETGQGGILIESRGGGGVNYENVTGEEVQSNGILLRCPQGPVFTMASSIYLRTGSDTIQEGPIVLDASRGRHQLITHAETAISYLRSQRIDLFGNEENPDGATVFSANSSLIDSPLAIRGKVSITNNAGLLVEGNIAQLGTSFGNLSTSRFVGDIRKEEGRLRAQIADLNESIQRAKSRAGELFTTIFEEGLYQDSTGLGSAELQRQAGFTFRTSEQCNASEFKLPESRWAMIARLGGESLEKWEEDPVAKGAAGEGELTFPFPGQEVFDRDDVYLQLKELKLFQLEQGVSKPRGADYEDFEYGEFERKGLDEYPTIL